jgi:NhaP-type Na+/H+ or K+/H+ antiporter
MAHDHPASSDCKITPAFQRIAMTMLFALLIMFLITSSMIVKKHLSWLSIATPTLVVSMIVSYLLNTFLHKSIVSNAITNDFIYQILLPVIVLAEGFNTRKKSLDLYKREIFSFGILMPVVSVIVNLGVLYFFQWLFIVKMGLFQEFEMSLRVLAGLAIVINIIDVHGSISPLHGIKNVRLLKILFNSGTHNNNMILVIVMTFERMIHYAGSTPLSVITDFIKVAILSIILGVLIGGSVTWLLTKMPHVSLNSINEMLFLIVGAYLSYSLAHLKYFELSGDVAIFFYGVMISHYTKYSISDQSFRSIGMTLNLIMNLAEAACYIYIGLSVENAFVGHYEIILFSLFLLFSYMLSRALCLAGFALFYRGNSKLEIKSAEWLTLVVSGSVKGPMAYIFANVIVAYGVPCFNRDNNQQYLEVFPLFVVQVAVIISIIGNTVCNYFVMKVCVTPESSESDRIAMKNESKSLFKQKLLQNEWIVDLNKPKAFTYLDEFYIKPLLIKNYHKRKVYIQKQKAVFDEYALMYDHMLHAEHEAHHGEHGHDEDGHEDDGEHGHKDHAKHAELVGHGHAEHHDEEDSQRSEASTIIRASIMSNYEPEDRTSTMTNHKDTGMFANLKKQGEMDKHIESLERQSHQEPDHGKKKAEEKAERSAEEGAKEEQGTKEVEEEVDPNETDEQREKRLEAQKIKSVFK